MTDGFDWQPLDPSLMRWGADFAAIVGGDLALTERAIGQFPPSDRLLRNIWCAAKPCWVLLLEDALGEGRLELHQPLRLEPPGVEASVLDLLLGVAVAPDRPTALAARIVPSSHRGAMLAAASADPPDVHSQFSVTHCLRRLLADALAVSADTAVMRALETRGVREVVLDPLPALAEGRLAVDEIGPVVVEIDGRERASYHDRTSVVLADADYSVMCGLASAVGLAQLGAALCTSTLFAQLVEAASGRERSHVAGVSTRPQETGYPELEPGWNVVIGWQATGILVFEPHRGVAVGFTSASPLRAELDKRLLVQQLQRAALRLC